MRLAVAVLSLIVAGTACTDALDPKTANLTGYVASMDAAGKRLLVNSGIYCTAITAPCYNYDVYVEGRIYRRVPGRYEEITFAEVQAGSTVWAWGEAAPDDPGPTAFSANRIVVEPPEEVVLTRRDRR